jgi:cytochrome oxidase Cu insertion factor (SCO1/SenC/PrrC family)
MNSLAQQPPASRNLTTLWILIAITSLPLIAAWLFFLNPQWLPSGRTHHGVLIDPPKSVKSLPLKTEDQLKFDWQTVEDMWVLVVLSERSCDAACLETLIKVRRIRKATAANRQRIARALIIQPDVDGKIEIPSLNGLEGTHLLIADAGQKSTVKSLFPLAEFEDSIPIFMIDPRGDLMMRYDTHQVTSKQILKDLERLLKASQTWSQGGQYGHQ